MTEKIPPEWAQLFEGKTCGEIMGLSTPNDLPPGENAGFERALMAAANAALPVDIEARKALKRPAEQRPAVVEQPLPPPAPPLPPLTIPEASTDVLLERQIASCVGIIEYMAHYIGRDDKSISACSNFMDRIASLMNSSATAAKMVGRYRGLKPAETCHRSIIERVDNRNGTQPPREGVLRA